MMLVDIEEINTEMELFNISKKIYSQDLSKSISESGLLEIPFLVRHGDGYYPLTCHNRLILCGEHGIGSVRAFILDEPDSKIFMNNMTLKTLRKETGPIGKVKAVRLLEDYFKLDFQDVRRYCKSVLAIPEYLYKERSVLEQVLSFPENLGNYLDSKELGFKVIRDLITLPPDVIEFIDNIISSISVRVNIFKKLVDYIFDISKRDGEGCLDEAGKVEFKSDSELLVHIFRIRYPDYSGKRAASLKLIEELSSGKVNVDFPEFFERDSFSLRIDIRKGNSPESVSDIFNSINRKRLAELQKLL